jgi:GT2 family glycosyltransferase
MVAQTAAAKQARGVYVIIPAYGRPALLAKALASLVCQRPALEGAIIVNNSCDGETQRVGAEAPLPTRVITPPGNLGTAGGIAAGMREFLAIPDAMYAWIMDDDAVATPGALDAMLLAMQTTGADAAAPLIADEENRVWWVPCSLRDKRRRFIRSGPTCEDFVRECGEIPRPWSWSIWASVVISRRAIEAVGFPRLELWSQFSDIEYTLRVTERFVGVLAPRAVCRHLPPTSDHASFDAKLFCALQNGNYVALRLRQGRRALRHLPGQHFRYLRHYRWRPRAWFNVALAFWEGAVLGRPSGRTMQSAEYARAQAIWNLTGEQAATGARVAR